MPQCTVTLNSNFAIKKQNKTKQNKKQTNKQTNKQTKQNKKQTNKRKTKNKTKQNKKVYKLSKNIIRAIDEHIILCKVGNGLLFFLKQIFLKYYWLA